MASSAVLAPEEFRDALRKGLGRAVQYVHAAPARLVREPLLDACVRYVGYDMMCEGSRVPWLYDMILCTGEPDWYCAEALKALEGIRELPEDSRDLYQLVELLAVFALNDHPELKEILRRTILDFKTQDGSVFWSDLPAEIFGVDGLVAIARRHSLMEERDYAVSHGSYLLAEGDKKLGPSLAEALRSAEENDETLRAYLLDIATPGYLLS